VAHFRGIFVAGVTAVTVVCVVLLVAPYGGVVLDHSYAAMLVVVPVGIFAMWCTRHRHLLAGGMLLGGCCVIYFMVTGLSFRNELAAPGINGIVDRVERSRNHQYPRIVIKIDDGRRLEFEGVSESFYSKAKVGDRFTKQAGSKRAKLNGMETELVDPSLLDGIRAAGG
jgi:hypothetical protein